MREYSTRPSERACPQCGERMTSFDYRANPLELDACPLGHGIWLDAGEEKRVREYMRERVAGLQRAAAAEGGFARFMDSVRGKMGGRGR